MFVAGGLYYTCSDACNFTISDTKVVNNTASTAGGGFGWLYMIPTIHNMVVKDNRAPFAPELVSPPTSVVYTGPP